MALMTIGDDNSKHEDDDDAPAGPALPPSLPPSLPYSLPTIGGHVGYGQNLWPYYPQPMYNLNPFNGGQWSPGPF